VKQTIYDNIKVEVYQLDGHDRWYIGDKPGFDSSEVQVPQFSDYQHTALAQALSACWVDILMLVLFSILFFAGAFVSFIRYDVR